jgi:hypothetical protein
LVDSTASGDAGTGLCKPVNIAGAPFHTKPISIWYLNGFIALMSTIAMKILTHITLASDMREIWYRWLGLGMS